MQARLSDWSRWIIEPEKILDGSTAEQACDFINRYAEDIELLEELKLKAFRISLNWPAMLPDAGAGADSPLDPDAVVYYRKVLSTLKEKGIVTFVTLFHFCLPSRLAEIGGWCAPETAEEFGKFTEKVVDALGDHVDYWLTINEPMAYVYQSFVSGQWTPGHRSDYLSAFTAVRHMLEGHAKAYHTIKKKYPNSPVSFTNHWRPFFPENPINPLDYVVCMIRDSVFNQLFPKSIQSGRYELPAPLGFYKRFNKLEGPIEGLRGSIDYLGVNYYTRELSKFKYAWPIDMFGEQSNKTKLPTNALGWEIFPEGLFRVLTQDLRPYLTSHDGKPRAVFITENGYADMFKADMTGGDWSLDDGARIDYLRSHLTQLHNAIKAGINVRGYLHWSLLDNFEWSEGLSPRFGLVRVSYPDQVRAPRKSASVYADIAVSNSI